MKNEKGRSLDPSGRYSVTELAALSGIDDATLYCRLRRAGVAKNSAKKYLGSDVMAADGKERRIFRAPRGIPKTKPAPVPRIRQAIRFSDDLRAFIDERKVPKATVKAVLAELLSRLSE